MSFFKQHQENIPLIIPWLILPLPFLVLALYILCERNFALFASVLPFLLVSISLGIFVYRWAIYVDKLREIDEKIETMVILADAKLMEKIGVAEDEIRNGKTRPFAELLKEADL